MAETEDDVRATNIQIHADSESPVACLRPGEEKLAALTPHGPVCPRCRSLHVVRYGKRGGAAPLWKEKEVLPDPHVGRPVPGGCVYVLWGIAIGEEGGHGHAG